MRHRLTPLILKISRIPMVRFAAPLILVLLLLLLASPASADIGPKPSMDFSMRFETEDVELLDGQLLLCNDEECESFVVFMGPFWCTMDSCTSYALWGEAEEYVEHHKLVLTFQDQVRESNVFTKQAHIAKYKVLVKADSLEVSENRLASMFTPYLLLCFTGALFLTVLLEAGAAYIYLRLNKLRLQTLMLVALANFISLSLIWFLFASISNFNEVVFILLAETFAVIFEAGFLFFTGRKFGLNQWHSVLLSLFMNLASFSVGYLGWFLLSRS